MYVYLWLIHVEVWQKTTKFYKAIILQLKNKYIFLKGVCEKNNKKNKKKCVMKLEEDDLGLLNCRNSKRINWSIGSWKLESWSIGKLSRRK